MLKHNAEAENIQLKNRIQVLERRNASLRAEVERLVLGKQPAWTPFEEADTGIFGDGRMIEHGGNYRVVVNSRYQVAVFFDEATAHLSIKRVDGAACHDWRDFQRIKNELAGPEAEAVELYPAESRLVDGANQYHLFVLLKGQWPVGFRQRLVAEDSENGVTQRPWGDAERPDDISVHTVEDMARAAGIA